MCWGKELNRVIYYVMLCKREGGMSNNADLIKLAMVLYCVGMGICMVTFGLTFAWRKPELKWLDLLKNGNLIAHSDRYVVAPRARVVKILNRTGTGFTLLALIVAVSVWFR